eukprot:TRINITY_DN1375_c0_g2_i1.p1 TRINITY_DN1375_c0_g2~~TRINITY_DN1375_c0_g2_i1.p1  ORF type:complete len:347 (-),score=8.34 TRINITY_DN1375_c0_g2_i1:199-1239(-)
MSLFEEPDGVQKADVRWFYQPSEVSSPTGAVAANEVFLGTFSDENRVMTLVEPVEVLPAAELKPGESVPSGVHVCRRSYDHSTASFGDLAVDPAISPHLAVLRSMAVGSLEISASRQRIRMARLLRLSYWRNQIALLQTKVHSQAATAVVASSQPGKSTMDQAKRGRPSGSMLTPKLALAQPLRRPPQNWPYGIRYVMHNVWKLPGTVRARIDGQHIDGVEIRIIPKNSLHPARGQRGLFATRDWEAAEVVGEYTGVVIKNTGLCNKHFLSILCYDGSTEIDVDAEHAGNETRFINDFRETGCDPNVKLVSHAFAGSHHILVHTLSAIRTGDELLADYGDTYWETN